MQIRRGIRSRPPRGQERGLISNLGEGAGSALEQLEDREDEQSYGTCSERHGFDGPIDRISHGHAVGFGME